VFLAAASARERELDRRLHRNENGVRYIRDSRLRAEIDVQWEAAVAEVSWRLPIVSVHSGVSRHTTFPVATSTHVSEASGSLRLSKGRRDRITRLPSTVSTRHLSQTRFMRTIL
jgi:hypothetical protein